MLFYIYLALLVVIPLLFLRFSKSYDRWPNFFGSLFAVFLVGGMLFLFFVAAGSSVLTDTTHEKTYTVDQKVAPTIDTDNDTLKFQYLEDGKVLPFNHSVDDVSVSLESVKEIKITTKDANHPIIAPWTLGWGYTAEFIK